MNIYEKLNEARILFQTKNVKMSGHNKFAGYSYYELSDILPVVNVICRDLKCACIVRYEKELAYLDFVDCEKAEDKITFSSPMSEASLKGCHAVQNLGAVETYIKRYLYQACFEIVESDTLDMTMNPNENGGTKNDADRAKLKDILEYYEAELPPEAYEKSCQAMKENDSEKILAMLNWNIKFLASKGIKA